MNEKENQKKENTFEYLKRKGYSKIEFLDDINYDKCLSEEEINARYLGLKNQMNIRRAAMEGC